MHRYLLLFGIYSISCTLLAQSRLTEHTMTQDGPEQTATATIEDFGWLAGRWEGTGFDGIVEETWNPPLGGSMAGTFRMIRDHGTAFYEMLLLVPKGKSIVYQVKHFQPDFTAWEEKDEYVEFPLVRLVQDTAYFQGLTIARNGDRCTHYLAMRENDGTYREVTLEYLRSGLTRAEMPENFLALLPDKEPIPVMIVGSYHMGNPGADLFNLEADDVLSPHRQQEIQAVVDRLALWKPTKIAIEASYGDSLTQAGYQAYLHNDRPLERSEDEQLGFRLAKQLGHDRIYPIDVRMGMDFQALEPLVKSYPEKFGPYLQEMQEAGPVVMEQMQTWLREGTVGSMLFHLNNPGLIDLSHAFYFQSIVPVVYEKDYTGADVLSSWYHRNLRIFSNLHQITDRPDDRILIIFGQGHAALLKQFAEDSPYFRVDDVQAYLRGL